MSVKTTKKLPRAMPVETIITRYKSAQQKLKVDKEATKATKPRKHKSEVKAKLQVKQVKVAERSLKKVEEESVKEFYPDKLKREILNKKIVLMPKHCLKIIGGTNGCNKRKMQVPRKEVTKRARYNSRSSTPSDTNSPKHKAHEELSIKDMVLLIEEQGGLDEEDLLEILTCPSPVWWEDPPAGYVEDPILTRPRPVERKSVKNQLIEEQIKDAERKKKKEAKAKSVLTNVSDSISKNLDISLDVSVRNRDVNFMNKRCKLESLLGSIKNKVKCSITLPNNNTANPIPKSRKNRKIRDNTDGNEAVSVNTIIDVEGVEAVNGREKRISDSFEEDSFLHLDDDGILSLENINIPIAPNDMLVNRINTSAVTAATNNLCRKKSSKTKTESDVHRKRLRENKSLLLPEFNIENKRRKIKVSPVKMKNPALTDRNRVKSKYDDKNEINVLPAKKEYKKSNDTVNKIKETYIKNKNTISKDNVNEIRKTSIHVKDCISRDTNDIEESPKKIENKILKDCKNEILKDCKNETLSENKEIHITNTQNEKISNVNEIDEIPLKIEDNSEDNVREIEETPVTNKKSTIGVKEETEETVVKTKDNISNFSEIKETYGEKIENLKGANICQVLNTSMQIEDVLDLNESDINKASIEVKNINLDSNLSKIKEKGIKIKKNLIKTDICKVVEKSVQFKDVLNLNKSDIKETSIEVENINLNGILSEIKEKRIKIKNLKKADRREILETSMQFKDVLNLNKSLKEASIEVKNINLDSNLSKIKEKGIKIKKNLKKTDICQVVEKSVQFKDVLNLNKSDIKETSIEVEKINLNGILSEIKEKRIKIKNLKKADRREILETSMQFNDVLNLNKSLKEASIEVEKINLNSNLSGIKEKSIKIKKHLKKADICQVLKTSPHIKDIVLNLNKSDIKETSTDKDINLDSNFSEIKEKGIQIKENKPQSVTKRDTSMEIIDVLSDSESDIDVTLLKIQNTDDLSKKEHDHTRRASVDSDVSDRNMSEEYLDMSVFDDEEQKIELTNYNLNNEYAILRSELKNLPKTNARSLENQLNSPVNIDTDTGPNIFDEIDKEYNEYADEKTFNENSRIDQTIEDLPKDTDNKLEYIEVYKIINSDSDNELNLVRHNEENVKKNDDENKTEASKGNDKDRPINFYYKQRKIVNANKMKAVKKCDCKLNKSIPVSDNDAVKYCFMCSSIFDTEECKYCIGTLKDRCSCENRAKYECNVCNTVINSKEAIIQHINDHNSEENNM